MSSHSILLGSSRSQLQFIGDLTNLCKRHKVNCGNPQDLEHLGIDLVSNDNFRIDLFMLCTAISHMAEVDLSPEQLLILVARAFGGSEISISDDAIDVPQSARSAFLDCYETWSKREPDPDAYSPWDIDRDHEQVSTRPRPTLFYSAASRAGVDSHKTQDSAPSRRHIPANTPLESLTLSELRMYLEDIENRVSRIEPRLERIAPSRFPTPERVEQPEILETQLLPEANSTVDLEYPEPAIVPEAIAPAAQTELALNTTKSSPLIIPQQDAIVADAPSSVTSASSLRRLRIVNAVLTLLLILVGSAAAIFGYRYLRPQPATVADATRQLSVPPVELPSKPSPADPATKATAHNATPTATSPPIPASIHPPDKTTSTTTVDTHPSQPSPTEPAVTPVPVPTLPSQIDTKKLEPAPTQATEAPPPSTTSDNESHSQVKPLPPDAQPNRNIAEPEHTPPPSPTHPLVASATSIPPKPAGTSTLASIPHSAIPPNTPVAVPAAMIMTYAISTPKPIYPSFRHSGLDSTIDVEATISKDGKVTSARAINGAMDVRGAAVRAVQDWRFTPYILDGKPVAVITTFKFVFKGH